MRFNPVTPEMFLATASSSVHLKNIYFKQVKTYTEQQNKTKLYKEQKIQKGVSIEEKSYKLSPLYLSYTSS